MTSEDSPTRDEHCDDCKAPLSEHEQGFCPHCERELAHPEDLHDNDHIKATGLAMVTDSNDSGKRANQL